MGGRARGQGAGLGECHCLPARPPGTPRSGAGRLDAPHRCASATLGRRRQHIACPCACTCACPWWHMLLSCAHVAHLCAALAAQVRPLALVRTLGDQHPGLVSAHDRRHRDRDERRRAHAALHRARGGAADVRRRRRRWRRANSARQLGRVPRLLDALPRRPALGARGGQLPAAAQRARGHRGAHRLGQVVARRGAAAAGAGGGRRDPHRRRRRRAHPAA